MKPIPATMIAPMDAGNDTYVEARDARRVVGYLRDFTGPVSPEDECACNPLRLTLAFNADHSLRTLVAPAPLEKEDHEPLTPEEMARLIAIAKSPPEPLQNNLRVETVLDGTSGATRKELSAYVIPLAALSTQRIVNLVRQTRRIVEGAPASRDQERLAALLAGVAGPAAKAQALAAFLPTAESDAIRQQVFRAMVAAYRDALLTARDAADPQVETRLLAPGLPADINASETLRACQILVEEAGQLELGTRCLAALSPAAAPPPRSPLASGALARLRGTVAFQRGDMRAAYPALRNAAASITLNARRACTCAWPRPPPWWVSSPRPAIAPRSSDRDFPRLPGAGANPARLPGERREPERGARRGTPRHQAEPAGRLAGHRCARTGARTRRHRAPTRTAVTRRGWHRHGARGLLHLVPPLPRRYAQITAFVAALRRDPESAQRVRVLGVRTAVERETEPYESFLARYQPNFPIYTDATMSLAFARFAKATGIKPMLPTIALVDKDGVVRLLVESNPYRDTVQDLTWGVRAILDAAG